jgi:hypothetical protein
MKNKLLLTLLITSLYFSKELSGQNLLSNSYDPFRYFAGTSEPDPDWNLPGFDDSGWTLDTGAIGYGYGFEDVQLDPSAHSVYIRQKFNVDNRFEIKEVSLFAAFDDGYIAYLNGKEIARVNVDSSVDKPAYDDLTIRSREWQDVYYDLQLPVLAYYFDSTLLDSCLVNGENVLTFHVMNDSLNGSDLLFYSELYNVTVDYYNYYDRAFRYIRQLPFDSTILPIVYVNTDEFGIPWKNQRVKTFMGIIDNEGDSYNRPDDSCNVYYGDVSIEIRGESSSEYPKRSYRFELNDSAGGDTNVVLLGMPRDNDWILYGPFADKAQFRNKMVFDMGRNLDGSYQPRSEFCEFILNGEFMGLYALTETIKREDDRVDIAGLRPDEISGNELTGGYILKYDKPNSFLEIVYPKPDDIQPEQVDYINGFLADYKLVLNNNGFMDPDTGFRKFINDTSLVDYLIVNEITKNADAYKFSTYFYKDRDDRDSRIHYGPLWDYDLAFGNTIFQQAALTTGWQWATGENSMLSVKRLFQDTSLVNLFQERYHVAREGCFSDARLFGYIDSMVNFLSVPVEYNYQVWPVIDEVLFHPNYISTSYENEIWNIKNWLTDRLDWIDANVDDIFYEVHIVPDVIQDAGQTSFAYAVFPNPFSDELSLTLSIPLSGSLRIELIDCTGRIQYGENHDVFTGYSEFAMNSKVLQHLARGIYLLRITLNNRLVAIQRVVKE